MLDSGGVNDEAAKDDNPERTDVTSAAKDTVDVEPSATRDDTPSDA
jgi:hypothetical protein